MKMKPMTQFLSLPAVIRPGCQQNTDIPSDDTDQCQKKTLRELVKGWQISYGGGQVLAGQ